jgi:hypothetical protein
MIIFKSLRKKAAGIRALRLPGLKNSVFMKSHPSPVNRANAALRST